MLKHLSTEERRTLANRSALKRKNPGKIRLSVFRSGRHIEIQAIDDVKGHTVCAASSKEKDFKGKGWNVAGAEMRLPNVRSRQKSPTTAILIVGDIAITAVSRHCVKLSARVASEFNR